MAISSSASHKLVSCVLASSPSYGRRAQAQEQKPDIAAIVTDVGWGDLGSCGGGVMHGVRRLTPVLFDQTLHNDLTTKPNRQASY